MSQKPQSRRRYASLISEGQEDTSERLEDISGKEAETLKNLIRYLIMILFHFVRGNPTIPNKTQRNPKLRNLQKRLLATKQLETIALESTEEEPAPAPQPKINIVLNWLEELKERAPVD